MDEIHTFRVSSVEVTEPRRMFGYLVDLSPETKQCVILLYPFSSYLPSQVRMEYSQHRRISCGGVWLRIAMSGEKAPDAQGKLLAYHAAQHDLVSALYRRLSQVTSVKVADQFLAGTAEAIVKSLSKEGEDPVAKAKQMIADWGVALQVVKVGNQSVCKATCPFAVSVHPKLVGIDAICPASMLLLGAIRVKHRKSSIAKSSLTPDGSEFTILHQA